MEWKKNFSMEYGTVKVWNGMKTFINGKNSPYFYTFSILAHFNVFILNAVNKAVFGQIHKMIKERRSSQRSIQMNRVKKEWKLQPD